jgi:hypothetical protein
VNASAWFEDLPVVGQMTPSEAAAKLIELDEPEAERALALAATGAEAAALDWPFGDRPWQHTAHAFGYLAPALPGSQPLPIQHAGNIVPDPTLREARIKITLDRLRVADYPGGGTHQVLFDFYAQNQVPGDVEHLHFNVTQRVREGQQSATLGFPIFVGLNVGSEGVAFKCFTVNVRNDTDEAFVRFLESDVFRAGLKLASTAQPAIAPFAEMAYNLTRNIATRNRNVPVQDFYLGLDFGNIVTRARLAEGSYLAVQIPESLQVTWDWREWVYNPANGQIVRQDEPTVLVPYNYVVLGVSRYEGP